MLFFCLIDCLARFYITKVLVIFCMVPDLTFIKVFGYEAFASTLAHNRTKLDHWARPCVYLGHRPRIKGSLHNLHTREVFLSRNVSFNENSFPFKHIINNIDSKNFVMPYFPDYQDTDLSFLTSSWSLQNQQTSYTVPQQNYSSPTTPLQNQQIPYIVPQQNYSSPTFTTLDNPVPPVIRKFTRSTKPPAYLKDFHCNVAVGIESKISTSWDGIRANPSTVVGSSSIRPPLNNIVSRTSWAVSTWGVCCRSHID